MGTVVACGESVQRDVIQSYGFKIYFQQLWDYCGIQTSTPNFSILILLFTLKLVPPKVFLEYDHDILTNASYHKDLGYITYLHNETYIEENRTINVTCLAEGAKPEANITWMIDGEMVDSTPPVTKRNIQENRTFDSRSTLQFSTIGEHVTVTCNVKLNGTDIETSASATFLTYVEPCVFLLLNGSAVYTNEVYVRQDDVINITCYAEGSRPSANLTWEGKHDDKGPSIYERQNDANNATFDTYLMLIISLENDLTIACKSSIAEINVTERMDLSIKSYVLPEPSITFNGKLYDTISINANDSVTLICNGVDSTPKLTLTWRVNGFPPHESNVKATPSSGLSSLIFQPEHNDFVQCVSYLDGPNITRVANVTFHVQADHLEPPVPFNYVLNLIVPFCAATLIILLVSCVYIATRRLKGSQSTNFSTTLNIPMEEMSNTTLTKLPQKEYVEGTDKTYPKPPDLELPQVPTGSEMTYYSDLPEQENAYELSFHTEYYSEMGKSGASGKMFPEKDICFIVNIKMGHIYDRWMGTIDVNPKDKKCVIFSTVSDSLCKKDIQLDKFVKRALELPDASHLTKVEGIGINEGKRQIYISKLYLIHEHLACETLDDRISDQFSRTEVTGYLIGILEGLEVIQSYGLLHPGLSTRKVLLTKQRICKLYDFCLSEDASNIVRIRKSRKTCTLNQLAPEALLRDKYSKESDVWSVAVVIWEILSCGSSPFPNEEQSPESENAVYSLPETWPTNYKLLRNKRLFDCWIQDTSLRPTISQLKSSFIENFEALDTYGPSNTSTDDLTSSYVHMKGIGRSDDDH
ncbi:Ephrin type-A receptor 10 [Holothuria leucospilota]|uniref:Ephrin type-A receptor 10 n=1 Tax=Holothuria leucospilota TaxID=206669 RepID=A0A9Q1C6W3_HOLLE|nr:Ephrin type-A receptor 10 [Holothuria leucospilota]